MKTASRVLWFLSAAIVIFACDEEGASKGEVWPKYGYLITTNDSADTVYVEGNAALTSPYSKKYPPDDDTKKWTIARPTSGKGVVIHNGRNGYWSIDSAFHPGLMVEQHFIKVIKVNDTDELGPANRFIYHKSGDGKTFYIESAKFPGFYVTGLGHAESGRGLRLRSQSNGTWSFWVEAD